MTLREIIKQTERLSPDERRQLIDHLTGAAAADDDQLDPLSIPQWHKDLLGQRLADHEANPDDGIPLEEFRAKYLRGE